MARDVSISRGACSVESCGTFGASSIILGGRGRGRESFFGGEFHFYDILTIFFTLKALRPGVNHGVDRL